jgi:hypothetical protein
VLRVLPDEHALFGHPKVGASWEGFALAEILKHCGDRNAFFWATMPERNLT